VGTRVEITARVVVAPPPAQVWRAVVDWPGQGRWMLGTRVEGGHGLGGRVVARTGIGPAGFTDTMIISEWDPPRRCVMRHTGRVVRGDGVFEVSAAPDTGGGSEFAWTERLDLPLGAVGGWGWRLVRPLAQRGMDLSLRRFARLMSGPAPG
jgi:uncharacterized protein YndB with AHSA1/START domain